MFLKKTLGQHFLRNPRILEKIVAAAELTQRDNVLEVGPGEGALTELLLQKAGKVIAVEKDARLVPVLQNRFQKEIAGGKLKLIYADILTLPVNSQKLKVNSFRVVANLPYYITGQFLRKFLQTEYQPAAMTLLLQKEVAKRIVAAGGRESVLSISVKAYGMPRYIDTVKAGSFSPPPKVDSAILSIENISKSFFEVQPQERSPRLNLKSDITRLSLVRKLEKGFFERLKKGFAHPRKLLSSNLGIAGEKLQQCGVPMNARAEHLSPEDWRCLTVDASVDT